MTKIELEMAENGVIKTIVDDNSDGAGNKLEKKLVYDFTTDKNFKTLISFFYELADDVGIKTGNKFDSKNLIMRVDWGKSYDPKMSEIESKINSLKMELGVLELMYEQKAQEMQD